MTRFNKLSLSKRILAIALSVVLITVSIPVSTMISALAVTGDSANITFTFTEDGLEGTSVKAKRTDGTGSASGTISGGKVDLNVIEGGNYDLSIIINETVVATSSISVPSDDYSSIPVTLTILPPTVVSVSSVPIDFGSTSAVFTATAVGLGELTYQWYEGAVGLENKCGTDSNTLTITDTTKLTPLKTGTQYFCEVSSNLAVGTNSNFAALTVNKNKPNVNLSAVPSDSTNTTFKATVFGVTLGGLTFVPNGSIEFYDGTTLLGTVPLAPSTVPDASASLSVTDLDLSNHTIKAVFIVDGGDNYFLNSDSKELPYNVKDADQQTGFKFATDSHTDTYYCGYTYTQTVTDPKDKNGNAVTYSINPATDGVSVDNSSGVVRIAVAGKAGAYTITATKPAANGYAVATATYTLTVNKATPDIKTAPTRPTITYGQTFGDATFTGYVVKDPKTSTSDTDVNGSFAFSSEIAGNNPTVADSDKNTAYEIIFTPTLIDLYETVNSTSPITVNKAKLTATANSPTIIYNNPIPLEVDVTGFVNNEIETSLASAGYERPTATCSTSNQAPSGEYKNVIIPAGGEPTDNYYFDDYVRGTLTINSAPIVNGTDYSITKPTKGVNGWFNKADIDNGNKFKISPISTSENPANGYDQISTSPPELHESPDSWQQSYLEYENEISPNDVSFYLRNSSTSAVSQIKSESYKIDITAPTDLVIKYDKSFLNTVVEVVTFGFYKAPVTVTVTATDDTSGVQFIDWNYKGTKGQYDTTPVNESADGNQRQAIWDENTKTYSVKFEITDEHQFKGRIFATATDYAGNVSSEVNTAKDKEGNPSDGIVVDNTKPKIIGVTYSVNPKQNEEATTYTYKNGAVKIDKTDYYNQDITVTVKIDEANFYAEDVNVDITAKNIDGDTIIAAEMAAKKAALQEEIAWTHDGTDHTASFTLTADAYYSFTINYTDKSTNQIIKQYESKTMCLDKTIPTVSVAYNDTEIQQTLNGRGYFKADRIATIEITEHNFRATDVNITVTAKDITGTDVATADVDVAKKYTAYAKNAANWTRNGDVYTITLPYDVDANYTFDISFKDLATNSIEDYTQEKFTVDKKKSEVRIDYDKSFLNKVLETVSFGFYQAPVIVTVTATDNTSGVQFIDWNYKGTKGQYDATAVDVSADETQKQAIRDGKTNTYSVKFEITDEHQFKGVVEAWATDYSKNTTHINEAKDSKDTNSGGIVVDNTKPKIIGVTYSVNPKQNEEATTYTYKNGAVKIDKTDYYNQDITVTVKIDEANFYAEDVNVDITAKNIDGSVISSIDVADMKAALKKENAWKHVGTVHTASFTLTADAYYSFTINYADKSTNQIIKQYESKTMCLDKTIPTVSVAYDNNNIQQTTANGRGYFKADRTATIKITEHNFRATDVNITVTAKDITGTDVATADVDVAKKYTAYAKNAANWTRNGDVYTITLPYDVDANYTFDISFKDLATNSILPYTQEKFTVDKVEPEAKIDYDKSFLNKVLETVSFGFYQAPVIVTVTATDNTSGVEFIDWNYKGTKGQYDATAVDVSADKTQRQAIRDENTNKYSVTFKTTDAPQFKGVVEAWATDYSKNTTRINEAKDSDGTNSGGIVVDNTKPKIIGVTYSVNPKQNEEATYTYKNGAVKIDKTDYYNQDITVTVKIDEANFYAEDVNVDITAKNIDGDTIIATEMAKIKLALQKESAWLHEENVHTATLTLTADAYYNFTVNYTDKSTNVMETYTSHNMCIDKTKPTVSVAYDNNNIQQTTANGRGYFKANRTATIEITEHNFRATDVNITVTAKDITEANVDLADVANKYTAYAKDAANWTRNGDKYTITLPYDVDANYTFDISFKDLATNSIEDYTQEKFTVDKVEPEARIDYNKRFLNTVLEVVTFGFYQAPVTVTVTATDNTSGVQFIDWNYKGTKGQYDTTEVNESADVTQRQAIRAGNTNKYSVTFTVTSANEFKGVVKAWATDYSKNTTDPRIDEAKDSDGTNSGGIVVDNTKPEIEVLYNPVASAQTIGETDYYKSDITLTFKITEANFYAEGVDVDVVAKDIGGSVISSIDVAAMKAALKQENAWSHEGNVHTATLTLTADAYYNFTVNYTDKSTNVMDTYTSRRLCLDKTLPSNLEIQYNTNPFREFLNLITFNLFENKVDVTIKAVDETAGVQYIEWQYVGVSGLDNSTGVNVSSTLEQKTATRTSGTNEYTIKFSISEQFKGEIKATAVDFATNRSNQDPAIDAIEIVDSKDPIITVTYPGDVAPSVFNGLDYYKADRTVKIEITEDNFVDSTTQIIITRDGQPYSAIVPASWNSNETSHVKQFAFNEDGDYTFEVISKDIVGRESKVVEKSFTLDKTLPVIGIVYNNNDVRNGNYYKAERLATITITEHNFNAADVNISVTATDDGTAITAPRASAWSTNGDVHTATINYSEDAMYAFSIAYTDLADNATAPFIPEEFYVDKTAPEIKIENVSDHTAYGETVQPNLRLFDINYGEYTVTLRRTDVDAASEDVYTKFDKTVTNIARDQGATINFANIPTEVGNDGIYNLSVTLIDKAGNETVKLLTFSVNRFGSTYYYADEDTKNLADKTDGKRFTNVEINIKIGEINVDPLDASTVTVSRNNDVVNELKDGNDYTVSDANEPGGWYACVYDIKAANFSSEGFYTIIVTSTDKAEHTSKNTVPVAKGNELPVEFTVDKTKPELTIKNIESRRAYSDAERKITIESTDINLNCESLKVYLDGSEVTVDKAKLVPDQFGKLSVELTVKANKGQAQDLEVKIHDCADNEQTAAITRFTLSANIFQLWYQNTLLFVLSLVGVAGLAGGLFFLLWKRRKKTEAK